MKIRAEAAGDHTAIHAVHCASFPTSAEADLVDRLRTDGDVVISLVAVEGSAVLGHVLFSKMSAPFRALGLAPVAVLVDHRRNGYAARLIKEGLSGASQNAWEGVFVLGDPHYYGRFGFSAAAAKDFVSPYAGPHFMFLPLTRKSIARSGRVDYAPAFSALD